MSYSFETYYLIHFPILEPVVSLKELYEESRTLFWAIAITSCRHQSQHFGLYNRLCDPFRSLLSNLLITTVQRLKDLQALLLICQWPLDAETGTEDPSWMLVGFVMNAALHMGLDKNDDEVLFGYRRAKYSLQFYDVRCRRRTWIQIFQISTQYELASLMTA